MNRRFSLHGSFAALALLALSACQSETTWNSAADAATDELRTERLGSVPNLHRFGDLYLAGQPTPADFRSFEALGVRTVLDIRHDAETPEFNEREVVEQLGMRYVYLPWGGPQELTDEVFDEMRAILADAERPLLFHCKSANRVGAGWLAYRALDEGLAIEEARAEAEEVGLRTPLMEQLAIDYVRRQPSR